MKTRFYVIKLPIIEPSDASTDYFKTMDAKRGDADHCPLCQQPLTTLTWLPPFRVELKCWGKVHADVAFGGPDLLVSEAFMNGFLRERLVGLDFIGPGHVVKVVPKKMEATVPNYYVGRIKRANATFDDVASEAEYEHPWTCPECKVGDNLLSFKRLAITEGTWEGEDIFFPKRLGSADKLISERFKEFFERHEFKGVVFVPAEEFSTDYYRNKT